MKKAFFVLPILLILLFLSCTTGGVEWGLVGMWTITDVDGDNISNSDGFMSINYDDEFFISINLDYENGDYSSYTVNGTSTANSISKTLSIKTDSFSSSYNLNDTSSNYSNSDFDMDGTYILNCNTLTYNADFMNKSYTFKFTKQ